MPKMQNFIGQICSHLFLTAKSKVYTHFDNSTNCIKFGQSFTKTKRVTRDYFFAFPKQKPFSVQKKFLVSGSIFVFFFFGGGRSLFIYQTAWEMVW